MLAATASDIALHTGARLLAGPDAVVTGETIIDSRRAASGELFVAFKGERSDGNRYALSALQAGAAAVVLSDGPSPEALAYARENGRALLRAEDDDCEEFLLRLASYERSRHPEWLVAGVTGSVGKTTTKDMLACVLSAGYATHATEGNHNNLIGMPLTLLNAPAGTQALVLEMGMDGAGQIERMAKAARPVLAAITNVGVSHLMYLKTRENIARAKAEIVSGMEPVCGIEPAIALTSANDFTPFIVETFAKPAGVRAIAVGSREGDDVRQMSLEIRDDATSLSRISFSDGISAVLELPVPGTSAVTDAMLALALGRCAGIDVRDAVAALAGMQLTSMRLDVQTSPCGVRVIDDTYNASPASMASSLDVLAAMSCTGRRYAVLGEMFELGEGERQMHACVGAYAAAKGVDMLVCVGGGLAHAIAEGARTVGASEDTILMFDSVQEALEALVPVLCEGDVLLAKASRASGLDAFVKGVLA